MKTTIRALRMLALLALLLGCGRAQAQVNTGGGSVSLPTTLPNNGQVIVTLSRNCNGQSNCTTVQWDAGRSADSTTTSGSAVVTCPECKFQTGVVGTTTPPASVGEIFFATDSTSAVPGANTCLNNAQITFGGAATTTVASIQSDTQLTLAANSGTTSTGKACIAFGHDETAVINTAFQSVGCAGMLLTPPGSTIISAPVFQPVSGCTYVSSGPFYGQTVRASNDGVTTLLPEPPSAFNFSGISGTVGTACVTAVTCSGAIGSDLIFEYDNLQVNGIGEPCTSTLPNTALWVAGIAARLININGSGWCGSGGGNALYGLWVVGDEDLLDQGGTNFFGSIDTGVDAFLVTMKAFFITGMTSNTTGVSKCGLTIGNVETASSVLAIDSITDVCTQLGNSGGTTTGALTSINSQFNANTFGTPDSFCMFVGNNANLYFIGRDTVCTNAQTNEGAVDFFSTGAIARFELSTLAANGTAKVVTGAAGNNVIDWVGNSYSGGSGVWNGLGTWEGAGAAMGIAQAATNYTASTGWGTSGAAGNGISGVVGFPQSNAFTVTAAGTPSANPTVAIGFANPFVAAPVCMVLQTGGTGAVQIPKITTGPSTTGLTITWPGTPVASSTYIFSVHCNLN